MGIDGGKGLEEWHGRSTLCEGKDGGSVDTPDAQHNFGDFAKVKAGASCAGTSRRNFRKLGEAEACVHDVPLEKIHFHEVGAVDAIVDIVGACIGFEALGIEKFACSALNVGSGTAKMAHGVLPVPAPATARMLTGKPTY